MKCNEVNIIPMNVQIMSIDVLYALRRVRLPWVNSLLIIFVLYIQLTIHGHILSKLNG